MKTIIFFYVTLTFFSLQYSSIYASEAATTKAVTAGTQTVLGKTIEGSTVAGSYLNVAMKAYNIGQEIRKHNFPTIKEKIHAEKVAEKFALLTAENELQKCLIANRRSEAINSFGLPVACEDIAQMLSTLGGDNEVNRMMAIFNQYKM